MISLGWADVEAAMVADFRAGFSVPQIAARSGWGKPTVRAVLRRHGCPFTNLSGTHQRERRPSPFWWTDAETDAIRGTPAARAAVLAYVAAFPEGTRSYKAVAEKWRMLRRAGE